MAEVEEGIRFEDSGGDGEERGWEWGIGNEMVTPLHCCSRHAILSGSVRALI